MVKIFLVLITVSIIVNSKEVPINTITDLYKYSKYDYILDFHTNWIKNYYDYKDVRLLYEKWDDYYVTNYNNVSIADSNEYDILDRYRIQDRSYIIDVTNIENNKYALVYAFGYSRDDYYVFRNKKNIFQTSYIMDSSSKGLKYIGSNLVTLILNYSTHGSGYIIYHEAYIPLSESENNQLDIPIYGRFTCDWFPNYKVPRRDNGVFIKTNQISYSDKNKNGIIEICCKEIFNYCDTNGLIIKNIYKSNYIYEWNTNKNIFDKSAQQAGGAEK